MDKKQKDFLNEDNLRAFSICLGILMVILILGKYVDEQSSNQEKQGGCTSKILGYYDKSGAFINSTSVPVRSTVVAEIICVADSLKENQRIAKEHNLSIDKYGNINYTFIWKNGSGDLK